jgi:Cyanate permease
MQAGSDRTMRGGMLLVGLLLVAANLRAGITSVGPVLGGIRGDLGITAVTASVLIAIPLVAFAVFSPIAPLIALRFGIERTLGGSLIVLAAGIVVRSSPGVAVIWIGTVLLGFAVALLNVLLPALVKRDYPGRVGSITGAYSAVQSAFAAVAAGLAVPIAGVAEHGWRISLGIWAGLAVIAFAVFLPQLRNRSRPDVPARTAPTALGGKRRSPWGSPWGSPVAWQITLFMGLQSTVYYCVVTWWPSIEQSDGVSAALAGWHQFAYQVLGLVGTIVCAGTIHRLRDQRAIAVVVSVLMFGGILGQLIAPAAGLVWVVMIGAGSGGSIVLALALFGLRTRHHDQSAALSGMAQSVGYLLAAAGPIGIGLLHDATGGWSLSLLVLLGVVVAQIVFGVLAARDRYL